MGSRRGPTDRKPDLADPRGRATRLPVQLTRIDTPVLNVAAVPAWAQFGNQCSTRRCAPAVANVETASAAPARLPQLLTVAEVAEGLRVSAKTIRRMVARGDLPVIRIGRAVRIMEAEYARLVGQG
jgi:excisionase family DNA binding protein